MQDNRREDQGNRSGRGAGQDRRTGGRPAQNARGADRGDRRFSPGRPQRPERGDTRPGTGARRAGPGHDGGAQREDRGRMSGSGEARKPFPPRRGADERKSPAPYRTAPEKPGDRGAAGTRPFPAGHGRPSGRTGDARPPFRGHREEGRPRQTDGLASRRAALKVIREVTENGAWASTVLDRTLQEAALPLRDRRLAARLAYDTIERLMYLDHMLSQVMAREDTDIKLRNILRLGACQLLLEDSIPDMAATDTSVELCKELGMDGLAGVCNGILRNLIRRKDELALPDPQEDLAQALSIRLSAPRFLVEWLLRDYGAETTEKILSASGKDSRLTLRPNRMAVSRADFEKLLDKKVWEWEKGSLPDSYFVSGAANIGQDSDFLAGRYSIQSEQSQMACLAAAPRRGWMVLDACAAPGGKACYMAEMMEGTGRVQAWDVRPHRADLISAQVRRLKLDNVRPMTRDAAVVREDLYDAMDLVLLDAPCSGTGEMHDKPDSKYRMKPESIEELIGVQRILLQTVARYVRPGGVLVYSTCSVLRDENENQIRAFLETHPEFSVDPLPDTIPEAVRALYGTGVQLLQGENASGGFYICRMRRKRI